MNKILKLSGVSVVAILTAINANAAGYTCEELIEYTSCNDGYYLNSGECIESATCGAGNYLAGVCPDEWNQTYYAAICLMDGYYETGYTQEECINGVYNEAISATLYGTWIGAGCLEAETDKLVDASHTCMPCDAGTYQPTAGQTSCIDAPAGNYVAGTGATTYTPCAAGSYQASAGQSSCSTCPATGLTDKDGATVVATTATTGSTSMSACYVGEEYYFTDSKGIYHYKSDCALQLWQMPVEELGGCAAIAEAEASSEIQWESYNGACRATADVFREPYMQEVSIFAPNTEEACNALNETNKYTGYFEWLPEIEGPNKCQCNLIWILDENGLGCEQV